MSGGLWSGDDPVCQRIVCPELREPDHGSISNINDLTVRYACYEGYTLVGAIERNCQEGGIWSLAEPHCEIISCFDLSNTNFEGGSFIQQTYTYSSTVTFECFEGYTLNGASAITCEANRAWSEEIPSCVIVSCGEPGAILNGEIIGTLYTYGSSVRYSCLPVYELNGATQRQCGADGLWSGATPICQLIVCPELLNIEFGRVTILSNTVNGQAQYACIPGYELFGQEKRECLVTGEWEYTDPICAPVHCHHPHALDNGKVTGADYHFQKQIVYECFVGYELIGDSIRTCSESRRWSGVKPRCEIIRCEDVSIIRNGRVLGDNFNYGNSVTYVCNEGYELLGTASKTCTENWSWDAQTPECLRISCGDPPSIPFAAIIGNGTLFNTSNVIQCDEGYMPIGHPLITCLSSRNWFMGEFRCDIITCPPIDILQFGEVTGSIFEYSNSINFICDIGYDLIGEEILTCQANGRWDNAAPICSIVACPDVDPIQFGRTNSTQNTYGSVIRYRCNRGYNLVGAIERMCLDYGDWEVDAPYCEIASCPLVVDGIVNGRIASTLSNNYTVNSTVTFNCDDGYEMIGSEVIMCTDSGEWNTSLPACVKINCPQPGSLERGSVVATADLLTYVCNSGYILEGSSERRCTQSGQWDIAAPYCYAVSCPSPSQFLNGEILGSNFTYGFQIEYTCASGYILAGNDQLNCGDNGLWDDEPPICEKISCGRPPDFYGGEIVGGNYTYQDIIEYFCFDGYYLLGTEYRECMENGSWSFIAPLCERITCSITAIENGYISNSPSVFYAGSFISYECRPGFELSGSSTVECGYEGEQIPDQPPVCLRVTCPPLSNPANGVLLSEDRSFGAVAQFVCDSSYSLTGNTELRCQEDGSWDDSKPTCIQQQCPPPPDFHFGAYRLSYQSNRIPDNNFIVNDRIIYYCQDGYETIQSVTSQCYSNATWSHLPPTCLPVDCGVPLTVRHAQISGQNYTYLSKIYYICDSGFNMVGNAMSECGQDGTWVGERPRCIGECGPPPRISSSTVEITEFGTVKTATYTCSYGSQLFGSAIATCDEDGTWEYDRDTACNEIHCEDPPGIRFGSVFANNSVVGSEASYVCDNGFRLVGSVNIVCQESRTWGGDIPYCQPVDCGEPPGPHPYLGTDFSFGGVVRYQCEDGFHIIGGDSRIICQPNGQWSGIGPVCEQNSCGVLQVPAHVQVIRGDPVAEIYVNHTVEFVCDSNYAMVGDAVLRCLQTSMWSSNPPICEPILGIVSACDPYVNISNSRPMTQRYAKGDRATIQCDRGHYSQGNMDTVCLPDGSWEVPRGRCRRRYCGRPRVKDIMNIIVQGQSFFFNDQVRYMCRPGLNPSRHPPVLTCQENGRWDGEAACSAQCKLPCRNGGMCIGMNRCKCRPGYGGQQCEIPICILPCLNGGHCTAPYVCSCPQGYGGSRCHRAMCSQPCENGGKCLRPNRCQCYNGFQPPFCHIKVIPKSRRR